MPGLWRWSTDVDLPDLPTFSTQAEAEAWLTASYADLVDAGANAVSLFEGDRLVYGPMSLAE